MSITAADLIAYLTANNPTDDAGNSGGAIDTTKRPDLDQFSAAATPYIESDGADTRNITIYGRNAAGALINETQALNGVTPVAFTNSFERILAVVAASGDASRTVLVKEGSGGTVRCTLNPNQVESRSMFYASASDTATMTRYEVLYWVNTHATLSLTSAEVTLTADPSARIKIGLAASKGDITALTDRLTAPGGVSFVDDSVAVGVPTGALAAGERIATYIQQVLPANDPAAKSSFTTQLSGTTA